ncbi:MAG: phosphatidylglycerophosphatase A [Peptococcaceae bacterium]|nr:phosphatidylglycerophosphatase A [Peptococcaceae bacterium]MBT9157637.1 hypothetical protein [Bacillota bacterium]
MKEIVIRQLAERGVELMDIAELVRELQRPYSPNLTPEVCLSMVGAVLEKREVQHSILVGIALDTMAEDGNMLEPLRSIVVEDEPLFGVDEILALGITNVYGTIGLTNFGYLDKVKPGILRVLNNHPEKVHTFLDDIVAGIAAAASARIAHNIFK